MSQRPDVETQRQQAQQKLEQFRRMGFDCELDLAAARVQEGDDRDRIISDLERKRDNCYAAAKEIADLLAKLPKPKKEKTPR